MLLTEKEAETKWCPHVRMGSIADSDSTADQLPAYNRVSFVSETLPEFLEQQPDKECTCLGSRCSQWRWADPPSVQQREFTQWDDRQATTEPQRDAYPWIPAHWPFVPANETRMTQAHWIEPLDEANARRRGYCGLAGKPEEA